MKKTGGNGSKFKEEGVGLLYRGCYLGDFSVAWYAIILSTMGKDLQRLALALGILVIIGVIAFFFLRGGWESPTEVRLPSGEVGLPYGAGSSAPREAPEGFTEYRSTRYNFSLFHPADLAVQEFDEGGGAQTIAFESEEGVGFQIFIVPYTQSQITEERFRKDAPSGVMREPVEVLIDGARATLFFSEHALLGETREVWFIKNSFLFEVTTYKALDEWLAEIMATWKFL